MLKRIRYVSRQDKPMAEADIEALVAASAAANAQREVTGALVVAGTVFFQIIEGPPEAIDALYAKIRDDVRHTDVVCLDASADHEIRLFPLWSMRRAAKEESPATKRMKSLVGELASANDDDRASLADELALLMRSALRAA